MFTKKIGQDTFTLEPLPPLKSFDLQPRIAPLVATVIEHGAPLFVKLDLKSLDDVEKIDTLTLIVLVAPVVSAISRALPKGELEQLTETLLGPWVDFTGRAHPGLKMNGEELFALQVPGAAPTPRLFDTVMQGRLIDLWRLVIWSVQEVNFADFFKRGAGVAATIAATKASSSATSTQLAPTSHIPAGA